VSLISCFSPHFQLIQKQYKPVFSCSIQICDVCDDREQLVALFEEQPRSGLKGDHLGDGMSSEDSSDSKDKDIGSDSNPGTDCYENSIALQVGHQLSPHRYLKNNRLLKF
jgi:hypothetical protein